MSKEDLSLHILRKIVVDGFLLGGLIAITVSISVFWEPFQRGFFCGDESLMFPFKADTVDVIMLRTVGIALPLIIIFVCEWTYLRKERDGQRCLGINIPAWARGFYCSAISFGIGLCFSELATELGKVIIGRPRPFFFDVCQPSVDCSLPEWRGRYIQSNDYACTGPNVDEFSNMRKSFPSGHSSLAAYTMIFAALYLQKRMVWRGSRIPRHVLQFLVLMLSWFTALSRVSDYRHHWSDVLAGYTLGAVVAVLMFNFGTDLVQKNKHFSGLPQFELNLPHIANHQVPVSP